MKSLKCLSFFVLILTSFVHGQITSKISKSNGTPALSIPLTISSNAGSTNLYFGLDPTATDGFDSLLGETELPPVPPAGSVIDARFVDDQLLLGGGSLRDYRNGTITFNGTKTHLFSCVPGLGTTYKVKWNLPAGVTGKLNDLIGEGTPESPYLINKVMSGKDSLTVNKAISTLKMTITYALDSPAQYIITPNYLNPAAGNNITIKAQLADAAGGSKAIAGKVVTWSSTGVGGSFSTATSTTNENGIAIVTFTVSQTAGVIHTLIGTDAGGLTGTSGNITTVAGIASKYLVVSSRSNASAGDTVKITAQLVDQYNNAVATAGKTVTWSKTGTGGSFASTTSITDASGKAIVVFTTSSTIGTTHSVTATDNNNLTGSSGNISVTTGQPNKYIVTASKYSPLAGDTVKISAQLTDQFGNPVALSGRTITWSKTGSGGSLASPTCITDVNGKAIVVFTTSSSAPPITHVVTATDNNSLTGSTSNIITSAGPATKYIISISRNNPTVGDTVSVKAQLTDAVGNAKSESGHTVNWTSTNGGTFSNFASLTNANGIATIVFTVSQTSLTIHKVTGTDNSSLTGTSGDITTKAGAVTKYLVSVSRTNPVTEDTVKILAQLVDQYNNKVSVSGKTITWSKTGTGGSFSPTISNTDANGSAVSILTVSSTPGITHIVTATDNSSITGSSPTITTQVNLKVARNIIAVSNGSNIQLLEFGIDATATDGIDATLGETELPPSPPAGIFSSRFVDDPDWPTSLLGGGVSKDIRPGNSIFTGVKKHFILTQVSSGTTYKLIWNLPLGEIGLLNDVITGAIVNKTMIGKDSLTVNKSVNQLKMSITYLLGPLAVPVLKSPLNNSTDSSVPVKLTWNKSAFAQNYKVDVSSSENFSTIIWQDSTLVDTTANFSASPLTKYYWRVRAKNSYALNSHSGYSTVWNFTTKISMPEKPILATPVNNATGVSINPTLTWNAAAYASTYRLQVSKDINFSQLVFDDSTLTSTSKQVGTLTPITNYYWRVNSKNASGKSAFSDVFKFTSELTIPSVPQLVSPTNNAIDQDIPATLKWKKSFLATSYKLVVATDAGFTNVVYNDSTIVDTIKQVSSLSPLVKYYWKVRAKNGAGISSYSSAWNFTTKLLPPGKISLSAPLNNSVDQPLLMTLKWNALSGADKYHLEVASDIQFNTLLYSIDTTVTSTKIPLLKVITSYYWRVRGINNAGNGEYSDTWTFTTVNVSWSAELNIQDKNNTGSTALVFGTAITATDGIDALYGETPWPPTPPSGSFDAAFMLPSGEDKSARDFRLAGQDSVIWQIDFQPGLSGYPMNFSWDPNLLPAKGGFYLNDLLTGTIVNVNMRKVNLYSLKSTGIKSLIITYRKNVLPDKPILATPVNNATNISINPTLTWNASLFADTYRLQVARDANFTQVIFNDSTLTGTTKQVGTLLGFTNYYWRVNAKNAVGTSAYSDIFTLTTELTVPPTPELLSPVNNAIDQDLTLQVKWRKSFLASTYKLLIATDAGFTNIVVSDSTITDTLKQVTSLNPLIKYYWKVRAKNNAGISAFTSTWNFKTKLVLPEKPVLATPVNNATNISINPILTWNFALYADSYRLQVATDANFTQLIFNDSTLTTTTKQINTLIGLTKYYWRVNAKNTLGKSEYSNVFAFTTELTIPPVPELVSPANNVEGQDLTIQLKWRKSFLASTYKLIVSSQSHWPDHTILIDSTITDTVRQIILDPNMQNTEYSWKVLAKNNAGISEFSPEWKFKTKYLLPVKPILTFPAKNATNISINPTLSWTFYIYAFSYKLQVAKDSNFTQMVFNDSTIANGSVMGITKKIGPLACFTKYFWRVNTKNPAGNGPYSDVFAFTTELTVPPTPQLVTPSNNAVDQELTLPLKWKKSFLASTYKLIVSSDAGFTNVILSDSTMTDTLKQITLSSPLTKYYWKVSAKNDAGTSLYSTVWNFTTKLIPPAKGSLLAPANNSTNLLMQPTLSWNTINSATQYHLEVSVDNTFNTIDYQKDTSATALKTRLLLPSTTYYWRIRGINAAGNGEFTDTWSFTTLSPPGKGTPVTPANNSTGQSLVPTLSWSEINSATQYHLEVSTDNLFNTIDYQKDDSAITLKLPALKPSTTYYWRVRGINAAGSGEFSDLWSFRTVSVTWSFDFNLQDKSNTGSAKLTLGTAPIASDGIDDVLGESSWPPTPPLGSFDAAFVLPSGSDRSIRDFRNDTPDSTAWNVVFQPGTSGYPMIFTWDINKLPSGTIILTDDITGTIVKVDMKSVNSYTLVNTAIKSLLIKYRKSISIPISINAGWNLFGMPVKTPSMIPKDVFIRRTSEVYWYNGSYQVVNTLENGKGYWVKYGAPESIILTGEKVNVTSIPVKVGWNMIAGSDLELLTTSIISNPINIISSQYFDYTSKYNPATKIVPTKGYWIKTNSIGILNLPASSSSSMAKSSEGSNTIEERVIDNVKILISDASGNNGLLELRNDSFNPEWYDLPPVPPQAEFDVRWSSDRQVEKRGEGLKEIVLSSNNYPIKIQVVGCDLMVKDVMGGKIINKLLKKNDFFILNNKQVDKLSIEEVSIPTRYELSQNYPNPFNPETSIKYQLPENGKVVLKIFDIIGREVETLINADQEAGLYEIKWNASKYSSGVYFYFFNSGNFRTVKKLILIK